MERKLENELGAHRVPLGVDVGRQVLWETGQS